jgi:hypothetical protein
VVSTEWDRASGFGADVDAVAARRAEDAAALEQLGAEPVWLGLVESQYGVTAGVHEVAAARAGALAAGPDGGPVVVPMGLWHDEHRLVHEAALALRSRGPDRCWVAYADALYRRYDGGEHLRGRHDALDAAGVGRVPLDAPGSRQTLERKIRAVACYDSQLRALYTPGRPGVLEAFEPEQYWALVAGG